eukprot:Skav207011  [mRNA]  locus=scaffold4890:57729:59645:- [translate_table: standard]
MSWTYEVRGLPDPMVPCLGAPAPDLVYDYRPVTHHVHRDVHHVHHEVIHDVHHRVRHHDQDPGAPLVAPLVARVEEREVFVEPEPIRYRLRVQEPEPYHLRVHLDTESWYRQRLDNLRASVGRVGAICRGVRTPCREVMLPGTCTRPEIRVKLFCQDEQGFLDAQRPKHSSPQSRGPVLWGVVWLSYDIAGGKDAEEQLSVQAVRFPSKTGG